MSGSGHADIVKNLEEVIDTFTDTATLIDTNGPIFPLPDNYYLINTVMYGGKEIERVSNTKILNLLSSSLTTPTIQWPAYYMEGSEIRVYPSSITSNVTMQYIRSPKDPKWTYATIVSGEPLFDQSNADYQDFELPISDSPNLINKILKYAGVSIRENDVYQAAVNDETQETQKQG